MTGEQNRDTHDVANGAQRMALRTVMQVLVEQASTADPEVRNRIRANVDAFMGNLQPQSDLERAFEKLARGFVESYIRPPGEQVSCRPRGWRDQGVADDGPLPTETVPRP